MSTSFSNHNVWTTPMQERMNSLINWAGVRRQTNKYGEPTLCTSADSKDRIRVVALKMNKEFGTTITVPSIVNQYHWHNSSEEQKNFIRQRRSHARSSDETTSAPTLDFPETTEEKRTANVSIADVIVKCARLVREDKMTPEELCMLIDTL